MATSARKPARTASRATRLKRKSTQGSATSSRKITTHTRSSAKAVRGRSQRVSQSTGSSRASSSRASSARATAKKSTKTSVAGSRSTRRMSRQKQTLFSPLVKFIFSFFGILLGGVGVLFLLWFFILPSVLLHNYHNQNVLLTSNNLDRMDGKIVLAHFGNDQRDSRVFVIKGEERVEVPNGYGEYAIGVVPALLSVDNQSDETIRSVMSRILGVPVDELVVTDPIVLDEAQEDSDAEIENSVSFFFASNIASVLRTLSRENVIKNPSKAVMLLRVSYLASTQISQRVELSSYQETSAFFSGEKMMDLSPAEQKCSIAVINSTESTGLAHETAQMLESNGAYIVREDSISNVSEATHIEIGDQPRAECENLARKLKAFFPESLETGVQTEDSKRYRADIVLLLGLDVVTAHK